VFTVLSAELEKYSLRAEIATVSFCIDLMRKLSLQEDCVISVDNLVYGLAVTTQRFKY